MPLHVHMLVGGTPQAAQAAVEGLVAINRDLMARMRIPALYSAGVRYKREGRGMEDWQDARQVQRQGWGDCEDLSAWRAAELQERGEMARAVVIRTGPRKLHVVVEREDGRIEDPSRRLYRGKRKRTARRRT